MTRKIGNAILICREDPETCQECHKLKETRPYGPGGMRLCFGCAMMPKYKKAVTQNLRRFLNGEEIE